MQGIRLLVGLAARIVFWAAVGLIVVAADLPAVYAARRPS